MGVAAVLVVELTDLSGADGRQPPASPWARHQIIGDLAPGASRMVALFARVSRITGFVATTAGDEV